MKKLTQQNLPEITKYIMEEPEFNLFIIGDLENFSLDDGNIDLYAQESCGQWDFLILRYFDSYMLYSRRKNYDAKAAGNFLAKQDCNVISGKGEVLERLAPFLPGRRIVKSRLCCLRETALSPAPPKNVEIRRLRPGDASEMICLYLQIEEFRDNYLGREHKAENEIRCNLQKGGRSYGAFLNGKLAAIASTTAENSVSAMVVGVATLPQARQLGLASCLVTNLCREVLAEGRRFLCLFYNNPTAGNIYFKIGFQDIGSYIMLKRKTD
jgi:predicted GNAT family acetyltransferase